MANNIDRSLNNQRIAKNSILLNIRMVITLVIALYTSRVILATLGVEDFGIYSAVAGFASLLGFSTTAITNSMQRFLIVALERGDRVDLQNKFSICIYISALISVIILIICETAGLWLIYNKLNIPADRLGAAILIFQFSVLSMIVLIMSLPYNAIMMAYEKMSAFAYIAIFESVLKLAIVFVLQIGSFDRLKLYGVLLLIVQLIIRLIYSTYSSIHFKETKLKIVNDRVLFKQMLSFTGWSIFTPISAISCSQGLNILLNIFFNPIVNAARAISLQVQNAILSFSRTLYMAFNPQITKCYVNEDYQSMHKLIYASSLFNFYFLSMLSLPILVSTSYIIKIWLGAIPEYVVVFVQLMLLIGLVSSLSTPLMTSVQATGKLRNYQIWESCSSLMVLPVSYVLLKLEILDPVGVFVISLLFEVITQGVRVFIVCPLIQMRRRDYFNNIIHCCPIKL
ncbi:MAG: lipopolysaccharide biosynthesis protein [Rikenellaceae bacterium]